MSSPGLSSKPFVLLVALAAGLATALGAGPVASAAENPPAPYALEGGVTAPVHDYADAIRETVYVQAPDLDANGQPDRVAVDIVRPRELDGTARVPVVMDASPYYLCCGRGNESELKTYDADGDPVRFPLYYDNYFVPRGYGYVAVDMAGTGRSTGCVDQGGASDILSVKAVVDWLNGRASAVDADGAPVTADWSDGRTGMIGKSYDGTLANGVAATGVEGLETIVPISAISSWYDYDRYQDLPFSYGYPAWLSAYVAQRRTEPVDCAATYAGLTQDSDDVTGRYNAFWAERDYREGTLGDASQVQASVFVVHGLQDTNVKTTNFSRWWDALGAAGVDRKMWLTRLGHVDPFDSDRADWVPTLHRWFDHELMGIDNGIDREPAVRVERSPGRFVESETWPLGTRAVALRPLADGGLRVGRGDSVDASFVNSPTQSEDRAVTAGTNPNRLLFTSGDLRQRLRIAGEPAVTLDVSHTAPTGQVGVALVDYGQAERVLTQGDGARTLTTETCWGAATAADDACYRDVVRNLGVTPLQVLSRGWARLEGAGDHTVTVTMTANDVVVPAGHQLGLVVVGAARGRVVTVDAGPTPYTVDLSGTTLSLPVQGAVPSFDPAPSRVPARSALPEGTLPEPGTALRLPR
jgi:X-Pro dipeptidyl-peptidase